MSDKLTKITGPELTMDQVQSRGGPGDIESLLRFAVEKGASVETIERMMAVRRELRAERAKESFDTAMAALQAEMPVVGRNVGVQADANGKFAYKYAPFEAVIEVVKPYLQKHGFSFTLDTDTASEQGWVIAKCRVTHAGGHSETSSAKFPLGAGTRLMSTTQVYAAALTFASRRVFQNAFGIVTSGEDQNGATSKAKPPGPSSIAPENTSLKDLTRELWELLAPVRGPEKKWDTANQWLWREEILDGAIPEAAPHFCAARFREVITAAKSKLQVKP